MLLFPAVQSFSIHVSCFLSSSAAPVQPGPAGGNHQEELLDAARQQGAIPAQTGCLQQGQEVQRLQQQQQWVPQHTACWRLRVGGRNIMQADFFVTAVSHICMNVCVYGNILCLNGCIYTVIFLCVCVYTCICIYLCLWVYEIPLICVCTYLFIGAWVCTCLSSCVYVPVTVFSTFWCFRLQFWLSSFFLYYSLSLFEGCIALATLNFCCQSFQKHICRTLISRRSIYLSITDESLIQEMQYWGTFRHWLIRLLSEGCVWSLYLCFIT